MRIDQVEQEPAVDRAVQLDGHRHRQRDALISIISTDISSRPQPVPNSGEPQPFRQQLLHQPRAAGAERDADRDLAAPDGAAREQQARDVGAGDRQDQPAAASEHGEEGARPSANSSAEAADRRELRRVAEPLVVVALADALTGRRQRGPSLRRGSVRRAAARRAPPPRRAGRPGPASAAAQRQIDFRRKAVAGKRRAVLRGARPSPCTAGR